MGSGEWARNVDPAGVWAMLPADRVVVGDVFMPGALAEWGGPEGRQVVVSPPRHRRDGVSLALVVEFELLDGEVAVPGDALVRLATRLVDPNRLGIMVAAVRRSVGADVGDEQVELIAREFVAAGTPLLQVGPRLRGVADVEGLFRGSRAPR